MTHYIFLTHLILTHLIPTNFFLNKLLPDHFLTTS
jgi:hypothetical protein